MHRVENHVAERKAWRVVVAIDYQVRQLGPRRAAFKRDLKRVAVGVVAAVIFQIRDADPDRVRIEHPPLFHRLEAAIAAGLELPDLARGRSSGRRQAPSPSPPSGQHAPQSHRAPLCAKKFAPRTPKSEIIQMSK